MMKLAVMGDPIEHSLSPMIHQSFAKQQQHEIDYQKILVNKQQLAQALENFWQQGGVGLNLTSPLKEAAMPFCDDLNEAAKRIGCVNTLHRQGDKVMGYNTDADGFLAALEQDQIAVHNKKILIMGAGGAARAVVYALLKQGCMPTIYARRTAQVQQLQVDLQDLGAINMASAPASYDILINTFARTASLEDFQAVPVKQANIAFDLNYDDTDAVFERFAKQLGAARYIAGKNMLWQQAAKAYGIWTGAMVSFKCL